MNEPSNPARQIYHQSTHLAAGGQLNAVQHGNQFNLPMLTVVVEHVGSVIDEMIRLSDREKRQLQARVGRLEKQLVSERQRSQELSQQAARLKTDVVAGAARYQNLDKELRQAKSQADERIAILAHELEEVKSQATQASDMGERLGVEKDALTQIEYALEGRALVQFERAEVAERKVKDLEGELGVLRELLARYQDPGSK